VPSITFPLIPPAIAVAENPAPIIPATIDVFIPSSNGLPSIALVATYVNPLPTEEAMRTVPTYTA